MASDDIKNELDEKVIEYILAFKSNNAIDRNIVQEVNESKRIILSIINNLPEENKKIFEDKFIQKLSYLQIANKLNRSTSYVEDAYRDVLETLKKKLKDKDKKIILDVQKEPLVVKKSNEEINPPMVKPSVVPNKTRKSPARMIIIVLSVLFLVGIFLLKDKFVLLRDELNKSSTNEPIKMTGSSSLSSLSQKWNSQFLVAYPECMIDLTVSDSDSGIKSVINKQVDISNSSRPLIAGDLYAAQANDIDLLETRVAVDALIIIVNKNNPIKSLSLENLEEIFSGKGVSWNRYGNFNQDINLVIRDGGSGTNTFVVNRILSGNDFPGSAIQVSNTEALLKYIGEHDGAIGFVNSTNFPRSNKNIKYISLQSYADSDIVSPFLKGKLNEDALKYGDYPLSHYLYLISRREHSENVEKYLNWVLSADGQKVVRSIGLIPVNVTE